MDRPDEFWFNWSSERARGRRLVEEDSGDHLQIEERTDRSDPESPQRREDGVPIRGVPRGRETEGWQAAEEAPSLPGRRERAAAVPRHDRGVRPQRRCVRVGRVPRVPDHAARILRQLWAGGDRGVYSVDEWAGVRVGGGGWGDEEGAGGVQGDCREGAPAGGECGGDGRRRSGGV